MVADLVGLLRDELRGTPDDARAWVPLRRGVVETVVRRLARLERWEEVGRQVQGLVMERVGDEQLEQLRNGVQADSPGADDVGVEETAAGNGVVTSNLMAEVVGPETANGILEVAEEQVAEPSHLSTGEVGQSVEEVQEHLAAARDVPDGQAADEDEAPVEKSRRPEQWYTGLKRSDHLYLLMESLDEGTRVWKHVTIKEKKAICLHLIRVLARTGRATIGRFNAARPNWMPTAEAMLMLLDTKWLDMVAEATGVESF